MTVELVVLVLICVSVLAALAWDHGCRCEKCSFHVNEQRIARLRADELRHDADHKGFGFKAGEPDRFSCGDDNCNRNPRKEKE